MNQWKLEKVPKDNLFLVSAQYSLTMYSSVNPQFFGSALMDRSWFCADSQTGFSIARYWSSEPVHPIMPIWYHRMVLVEVTAPKEPPRSGPVFFPVTVAVRDGEWSVARRYSEFDALKTTLQQHGVALTVELPGKYPPPGYDIEALARRALGIHTWAVAVMCNPGALKHPAVVAFFALYQAPPESAVVEEGKQREQHEQPLADDTDVQELANDVMTRALASAMATAEVWTSIIEAPSTPMEEKPGETLPATDRAAQEPTRAVQDRMHAVRMARLNVLPGAPACCAADKPCEAAGLDEEAAAETAAAVEEAAEAVEVANMEEVTNVEEVAKTMVSEVDVVDSTEVLEVLKATEVTVAAEIEAQSTGGGVAVEVEMRTQSSPATVLAATTAMDAHAEAPDGIETTVPPSPLKPLAIAYKGGRLTPLIGMLVLAVAVAVVVLSTSGLRSQTISAATPQHTQQTAVIAAPATAPTTAHVVLHKPSRSSGDTTATPPGPGELAAFSASFGKVPPVGPARRAATRAAAAAAAVATMSIALARAVASSAVTVARVVASSAVLAAKSTVTAGKALQRHILLPAACHTSDAARNAAREVDRVAKKAFLTMRSSGPGGGGGDEGA